MLTNFAKRSILDVWQGSEYTFALGRNGSTVAKFSTKYLVIDKVHDPSVDRPPPPNPYLVPDALKDN